jgi:hypothetical protein
MHCTSNAVRRHHCGFIPAETPHAGGKAGDAKTRVLITYVVEKGKPLASPALSTCEAGPRSNANIFISARIRHFPPAAGIPVCCPWATWVKGSATENTGRSSAAVPIPDHLLHRGTPRLRAITGPSALRQTACLLGGLPNLHNPRHSDCKGRTTTGLSLVLSNNGFSSLGVKVLFFQL